MLRPHQSHWASLWPRQWKGSSERMPERALQKKGSRETDWSDFLKRGEATEEAIKLLDKPDWPRFGSTHRKHKQKWKFITRKEQGDGKCLNYHWGFPNWGWGEGFSISTCWATVRRQDLLSSAPTQIQVEHCKLIVPALGDVITKKSLWLSGQLNWGTPGSVKGLSQ